MGKILSLVALVLISACAQNSTLVEKPAQVQIIPLSKPVTPIAKPRPNVDDRNYTAPYPKLSNVVIPVSNVQVLQSSGRTTVLKKSVVQISPTRGATTTEEFLGSGKNSQLVLQQETVILKEGHDNTVLGKAMRLPPKEIDEGKYHTFRRIEDDIAHDTRKIRGKVAEFIFPEMNDVVEKPKGKPQSPVYCYKSFADSTCYSEPVPGQEFRQVGKY